MRSIAILFAFLLSTSAHAAEVDYLNSSRLALSPDSPSISTIKRLDPLPGTSRLVAIAVAAYCRDAATDLFAWPLIRCVARIEDAKGHTRYRRSLRPTDPEPPQDQFADGWDVRGMSINWTCRAEEILRGEIACNVTATTVWVE